MYERKVKWSMAFKRTAVKKVKEPTAQELTRGWNVYQRTNSFKSVYETLGISRHVWKKVKPMFTEYFARVERGSGKTATGKDVGRPGGITMTGEQRRMLVQLNSTGILELKQIANIMGIARRTVYNWLEADEILKNEFESANDRRNADLVDAMYRNGMGMTLKSHNVYKVKGKDGQVITENSSTTYRQVRPSSSAARLVLSNKLGWTLDGGQGAGSDETEVEYDIRESLYEGDSNDEQ